ncbi:hypothetical protein [Desulfobacter postgatei]|uniref:hypothetical protein n=1 Tax=Desulfobacter postgatei TaxID=2293 RepID=UPI002FD89B55
MNPSLKKLVILSLAGSIGSLIRKEMEHPHLRERAIGGMDGTAYDLLMWHCDQMDETGHRAFAELTRGITVDGSMIRQSQAKIWEAVGTLGEMDLTRALSFLCLGIDELEHYCQNNRDVLRAVGEAARGFVTMWDPNFEDEETHAAALADYERWIE